MRDPNEKKPEKINDINMGNQECREIEREGCKIQIVIPKGVYYDLTLKY